MRHFTRPTLTPTIRLAIAAGLAATSSLAHAAPVRQDLPIREITLLRSGVGQFVRAGTIEGDGNVQLRFQTEQINDILKSMYLLDLDGGQIGRVGYASQEPLERRLASFAVDIADMPDLPTLLSRLRGTPVALDTIDGRVEGTILGVERRPVAQGDTAVQTPFVTIFAGGSMRTIRTDTVRSFEILDEQVARELEKALGILAEHRADTLKGVDIELIGEGDRRVVVGYVHEMPVWKTSYRLILDGDGNPTIQGWAIVENTTDEDWQDVTLSLVAGQPVGFTMNLYQPLFVPRPEMPVPIVIAAKPKVYEESMQLEMQAAAPPTRAFERAAGRGGGRGSPVADAEVGLQNFAASVDPSDMIAGVIANAQATEVGEVFQYRLDTPVSIERQQSAMLPIITSAIDGRRISIYNHRDLADHPMRGVELTNSTDLQLMPGPIAVYDETVYAGDAQIGHVSPGDERILAYAVDLAIDADHFQRTQNDIRSLRIVGGAFEQTTKRRQTTRYTFNNTDADDNRTVIVEHPRMSGWTLVSGQPDPEVGPNTVRFEVEVPQAGSEKLELVYERTDRQRVGFNSYNLRQLIAFERDGKASQAVVDAIRELGERRTQLERTERDITTIERQIAEIDQDQSRIRRNMGGLDRNGDLYRRYVRTLSEQETRLGQLRDRLSEQRTQAEEQRRSLENYTKNLRID